MAFCIECGAKAPDIAKFCPQCGASLVEIETVSKPTSTPVIATPEVETAEVEKIETPEIVETEPEALAVETASIETMAVDPIDAAPSAAASIAAAASVVEDDPKSKAGLFIGLGLVALIAAGGGAYALGLFGGDDADTKTAAATPATTTPLPETETVEIDAPNTDPVLKAYQEAIKTGRISDLGQFAQDNSDNSLAKDAEDAAFNSLKRQSSVLAYNTFTEYFPNADISSYTGPREGSDQEAGTVDAVDVEIFNAPDSASSVRTSITQRAGELDQFIAQGDADYALLVIDEMLALGDLNEVEATYLLNLRAKAETSRGFITAPDPAPVEPSIIQVEAVEITPAPEPEVPETIVPEPAAPEIPAVPEVEPLDPNRLYDSPAKPVERFGAITPDAATEPGECDMAFSINTAGSPTNIIASCSNPMFVAPAKEAVTEWVYSPALLNGAPVQQNGVVVKIRFNLE